MAEIAVRSDMTAKVWKIEVAVGDRVAEGDTLVVLEAMKQELPIDAPTGGTVKAILVAEGAGVEEDQALVVLES